MSKKRTIVICILVVIMLTGLSICAYPMVSQLLFAHQATSKVQQIVEKSAEYTQQEQEVEYQKAREFNRNVYAPTKENSKEFYQAYYDIFSFDEGIMGIIKIPSIDTELPIYHGTDDETLSKGAGHYEYSSFPTGDINTHSIVTAHCGLPEAELFTNLDRVKIGDKFSITVMNITTEYTVDDISVVEPNEVYEIGPIKDKCYVSLVTCTPYRINTHRLVVRGVKSDSVENISEIEVKESTVTTSQSIKNRDAVIVICTMCFFIVSTIVLVIIRKRRSENEKKTD